MPSLGCQQGCGEDSALFKTSNVGLILYSSDNLQVFVVYFRQSEVLKPFSCWGCSGKDSFEIEVCLSWESWWGLWREDTFLYNYFKVSQRESPVPRCWESFLVQLNKSLYMGKQGIAWQTQGGPCASDAVDCHQLPFLLSCFSRQGQKRKCPEAKGTSAESCPASTQLWHGFTLQPSFTWSSLHSPDSPHTHDSPLASASWVPGWQVWAIPFVFQHWFLKRFICICVGMHVHACVQTRVDMYAYANASAHGAQRHQIPLNLQVLVNHSACTLRIELRSLARAVHAINYWAIPPTLQLWFS